MNTAQGILFIVGACVLVLCIVFFRKKAEIFINFILRLIIGGIGIYALNYIFSMQEIPLLVGMNPVSLVTVGIFGVPGLALLYGIAGCGLL